MESKWILVNDLTEAPTFFGITFKKLLKTHDALLDYLYKYCYIDS